MIKNKKIIALIPARGGSKSISYKNLQLLGNKSLLSWPIETALDISEIDHIYVSTDDKNIADEAKKFSVEIHDRPDNLASDTALVVDTIRHLKAELSAKKIGADIMVLLEATCPFRESSVVLKCLNRLIDDNLDSVATFHPAELNPERSWRVKDAIPEPFIDGAIPWKPRQLLTPAYQLNAVAYVFRLDRLPENGASLLFGRMGAEIIDSEDIIDIDTKRDFLIANCMLKNEESV
jgi:CMP-N,N'-diacetyllegionaminic acid synthase